VILFFFLKVANLDVVGVDSKKICGRGIQGTILINIYYVYMLIKVVALKGWIVKPDPTTQTMNSSSITLGLQKKSSLLHYREPFSFQKCIVFFHKNVVLIGI
jgi:hypothetical protein